jgi:hypothetical protein
MHAYRQTETKGLHPPAARNSRLWHDNRVEIIRTLAQYPAHRSLFIPKSKLHLISAYSREMVREGVAATVLDPMHDLPCQRMTPREKAICLWLAKQRMDLLCDALRLLAAEAEAHSRLAVDHHPQNRRSLQHRREKQHECLLDRQTTSQKARILFPSYWTDIQHLKRPTFFSISY